MRPLLVAVSLLLAAPAAGVASPAISCHCFRDREYDAARPAAADPYVLATARNSLLAAAFGVDKGEVVRSLMTGTSPDDLWVAHWAASRTGADAGRLLAAKAEVGSWKAALAGARPDLLGPGFAARLAAGADAGALSAQAVDAVLTSRLAADPRALASLRAKGASSQEAILCVLLAPRARRPPAELLADARAGRSTWGGLVTALGLTPKGIEEEIRRSLR